MDFPEGQPKVLESGPVPYCVAKSKSNFYAFSPFCPHRGAPLYDGCARKGKITCSWHAWEFDLATGKTTSSDFEKLTVYPVKVKGKDVYVDL